MKMPGGSYAPTMVAPDPRSDPGLVLMARPEGGEAVPTVPAARMSALPILGAVVRRSLPHLLEASVIPSLLFYVSMVLMSVGVAMLAAICWSLGAVLRRVVRGKAIPAVLLLGLAGLTVKTMLALLSGNTALYFLQPIATTVVIAGVFLGSLLIGRPLVARLAGDFCPVAPGVLARPAVAQLLARLTLLWAGVYVASAVMTTTLLATVPLATFVATKTLVSLIITGIGVTVTVACSLRTARDEGLVFGRLPVPLAARATVDGTPLPVG
ncbi:MAG: putative rane protein [Acidimicrobiales bacterium]|nr:putative rane protein [Acidimicrobiales bacterium]